MRCVFVDCTEELSAIIRSRQLCVPESVIISQGDPSVEELIRLCSHAEVALVEHTVLPNQVLDACPGLRAVVFMGTGAATYIDLPEVARRGIRVLTIPGYGNRSVAEHAFAFMLAAARNIATMDRDIRNGLWRPTGGLQLRGKKVAVLGFGGIGLEFANMACGFGMEVAGWNRSKRGH
jgi:D-3-phosphoglycerate dehydrogenase